MNCISRNRVLIIVFVLLLAIAVIPRAGNTQIPETINYQAYLTDNNTHHALDGEVDMRFSLHNALTGGNEVWFEEQLVDVENGICNVELGLINPLRPLLAFDIQYFLGVAIDKNGNGVYEPDEIMTRRPLDSVPYAFVADEVNNVADGIITEEKIADDAVTSNKIAAGAVGSAEISDGSVTSADVGFNYAGSSSKGGPANDLNCTTCVSQSELDFTPGDDGDWTISGNDMYSAVSGNVGIGMTTPIYKLIVKGDANGPAGYFYNINITSGGNTKGIYAEGNAYGTGTGEGTGGFFRGYGGSTGGIAYGISSNAWAYGSSDAYGVYSNGTRGSTTGREYALYGIGDGYFSGNLGIGTENPDNKLHVYDATSQYYDPVAIFESLSHTKISVMGPGTDKLIGYQFADPNDPAKGGFVLNEASNNLEFYTNKDGSNPRMVIANSGHVSIGSSPSTDRQLSVTESNPFNAGTLNAAINATSTNNHAIFAQSSANEDNSQHAVHAWGKNRTAIYAHTGNGTPGFNNGAALYAHNDLPAGNPAGYGVYGYSENSAGGVFETGINNGFGVVSRGRLAVSKVPVWDGSDFYDVTWNSGNGTISIEGSSRKYKQNIQAFKEDFRKILRLEARQYQMRDGYGEPEQWMFGYIAEELDEAGLNKLVIYDAEGRPDGIKYKKMGIYLNEIVKEQEQDIAKLTNKIAELTETVKKLEREMKLKGNIAMVHDDIQ
jgi:hypothetical protein